MGDCEAKARWEPSLSMPYVCGTHCMHAYTDALCMAKDEEEERFSAHLYLFYLVDTTTCLRFASAFVLATRLLLHRPRVHTQGCCQLVPLQSSLCIAEALRRNPLCIWVGVQACSPRHQHVTSGTAWSTHTHQQRSTVPAHPSSSWLREHQTAWVKASFL